MFCKTEDPLWIRVGVWEFSLAILLWLKYDYEAISVGFVGIGVYIGDRFDLRRLHNASILQYFPVLAEVCVH